jgi:hypothetical protein
MLESLGLKRARELRQLRGKRAQLQIQLVEARVAAAGVVASETSARASLEAARQSAEDQAISAETATATAIFERDSLASRLALAEVEIEKLRVAATSAEEVAESQDRCGHGGDHYSRSLPDYCSREGGPRGKGVEAGE